MKNSGLSDQQQLDPPAAPPAHEDLTIAEHLRTWKQPCSGEGEDAYRDETGEVVRVPEHLARHFVEEHGALHPGDYRSRYQRDWREDFAELADQPLN